MKNAIATAILVVAATVPAGAQQADQRWAPWLGCWQLLNDRVRDGNPIDVNAIAAPRERYNRATNDVTVCVAASSQPAGVTLSTRVAGEPAFEQTIMADAASHPLSEAGCSGTERAEWSRDGRRLFARADLACPNQPGRNISGVTLITANDTWLDVQAIDIEGQLTVRVRRYRRAAPSSARAIGGAALSVDDVKEAAGKLAPAALEAALIETGARFALNSRTLVSLDGTVPDTVIDLMVALSYPKKFQVERRVDANLDLYPLGFGDGEWSGLLTGWGLGSLFFPWYPGYYGNSGYYYSPFGYGYSTLYGLYSPYAIYSGAGVANGPVTLTPRESGDGRVVNGVGYTRIRTREATAGSGSSAAVGTSREGATVSRGGYTQSDGGSSSGASSSGGSSSDGSGGSGAGGRTAQPR